MTRYTDADHALALSGVFQAARMTYELARHGHTEEAMLEASLDTLFITDPSSVEAVYGELSRVALGLRHFIFQLSSPQDRNLEVAGYSIGLLQLGHRLFKDPARLQALGEALDNFQSRAAAFEFDTATRHAQLAGLYQEFISPLSPRIIVKGEPLHLQNPAVANDIRCALLAGIRSAHLWIQCGGRRWHMLTRHGRLLRAARALAARLPTPEA